MCDLMALGHYFIVPAVIAAVVSLGAIAAAAVAL